MADNNNLKKQSAQNTMMAEIIVTELEQFKESHKLIIDAFEKFSDQYIEIARLIIQINKRDAVLIEALEKLLVVRSNYMELTQLTMDMGNELRRIDKKGIEIQSESLDKIFLEVQKANKPIREHIRWLTYGVCTAFLILLMIITLM